MSKVVLLKKSDADVVRDVCEIVNGTRGGGRVNRHREDPPAGKGGSLQRLVITTPPNGGAGAAVGEIVQVNSDGTWQSTGEQRAVICPKLN
jgi:hypothetical protein